MLSCQTPPLSRGAGGIGTRGGRGDRHKGGQGGSAQGGAGGIGTPLIKGSKGDRTQNLSSIEF
jgi:hypothetical protein